MKLNRWSWGYIPVALVMGLIWYEFWRSGAYVAPPPRARTEAQVDMPAPSPAAPAPPTVGSTPPTVVTRGPGGTGTLPPITVGPVPTPPPVPEIPKPPVIDDNFFNNPPPITVSFNNATMNEVIDALRASFNMPSFLQLQNANPNDRRFSLEAKNMPFWEAIRALQAQGPIGFYPAGNVNGLGLLLSPQTSPVYRFQICGPAIVFPTTIMYNRTGSAQANPGETGSASYALSLGAAVDPRILVARTGTIELTDAVDDTGRAIPMPGPVNGRMAGMASTSNFWTANIGFPALEPRAKRATFKGQVRFAAQLAAGMVTLDDPAASVGQTLTVGDRQVRLERFEVQNNLLSVQFSGDTQPAGGGPGPGGRGASPATFNCLLIDSRGRTLSIPNPNVVRNFSTTTYVAPYRLILRDLNAVRELSFPFELKDVPLP